MQNANIIDSDKLEKKSTSIAGIDVVNLHTLIATPFLPKRPDRPMR